MCRLQDALSCARHGGGGQAGYPSTGNVSAAGKNGDRQGTYGLDGDTLGMDGAQVGVFEEGDEICLNRLLQSTNSRRLES